MTTVTSLFSRALGLHREAVSHLTAARAELAARLGDSTAATTSAEAQRQLAARLAELAPALAPGWLSCPLDPRAAQRDLGRDADPSRQSLIRLGAGRPVPDQGFPVVVPFLGAGHIAIDTDARDPRVTGWLRAMLLRIVAAVPAGSVRVLPVDGGTLGAVFTPFRPLVDAGAWTRPATDLDTFRAVLAQAEAQITTAQAGDAHDLPYLLVVVAALPVGCGSSEHARLAALAHAGPSARVHLLVAGYPPVLPAGFDQPPRLDHTTQLTAAGDTFTVSEPPGRSLFSDDGTGLAAPLSLDAAPADGLADTISRRLADTTRTQSAVDFAALMPAEIWAESSADGLRTVVGRAERGWCELALDDVTPHWLVGGRTGSGKTVFLLDVLYGLASRYSPDELGLYLLDFKEGVSFAEFTPTAVDGSWIPHARTVGIESDREYGLAVLRALVQEMGRRAVELKKAGVTRLADLRSGRPDVAMPRLVAVIDEFHVLFAGNDRLAERAAALLEELARKGRSYGIHLILASQTISGVEALFTKGESIFGQFPLRVALAGGGGVLDHLNNAADNLPVGTAAVNTAAGVSNADQLVRFPDAVATAVTAQRHRLWNARPPGDEPPAVFAGYAEQHLAQDPTFARLSPDVRRRRVLVGRVVDVGLPTAGFTLDGSPGRHVAVVGPSPVGADILHAAAISVGRQYQPGTASFAIASLVGVADDAADATADALTEAGHRVDNLDAAGLRAKIGQLAGGGTGPTYVVVFGADAASASLGASDPETFRTGLDDLRDMLRAGPAHGVHLLAWWRGLRRFSDDIGGSAGLEDVSCLVALNVPANDLGSLLGDYQLQWQARPNRALLIDRHDSQLNLIVPFVRPGTLDRLEAHR